MRHPLIWKEWHEQGWKVAFGCIVLAAFAAIGLRARVIPDETMLNIVCAMGMVLLPVLAASGLVPAERADGAFDSLVALPVRVRTLLAMKAVAGLSICVIPLAAALIVSVAIAGNREMTTAAMFDVCARSSLAAAALFMWMFALTIRLPTEARAAMLSIGVMICWAIVAAGFAEGASAESGAGMRLLGTASPFSIVYEGDWGKQSEFFPSFAVVLPVQLAIGTLLWLWASHAIGRRPAPRVE